MKYKDFLFKEAVREHYVSVCHTGHLSLYEKELLLNRWKVEKSKNGPIYQQL